MTEIKKERSSNFELLRIFAMMMIILYHIVCHCIINQLTGRNSQFVQPCFSEKVLFLALLNTFGQIGNAIFILISGFFMARRESEKINLEKISVKLLSQLFFATTFLMFGSLGLHRLLALFNKFPHLTLIDVNFFNDSCWFIGYYFLVILFGKFFLNEFLSKLDKKYYLTFLLTIFTLDSLSWSRNLITGFSSQLDVFLIGIFLYSFGGFIKKFNPFEKTKISFFIFAIIFIYFFVVLSDFNITDTNIEKFNGGNFLQVLPEFSNYQLVPVSVGICLFEIFRRIKIPNSKSINYLGSSTLMVYLIHDNIFFYRVWKSQKWIQVLFYHPIKFCGKILIWAIMTFVAGFIAYVIYDLMMTILRKCRFVFLKKEKSISLS